ncbi:MAG: hypothetical protein F6J96_34790 [Symploca sp. SIO1C2]|nr:hypothetical protein [Symploca sp. SIO1C2]
MEILFSLAEVVLVVLSVFLGVELRSDDDDPEDSIRLRGREGCAREKGREIKAKKRFFGEVLDQGVSVSH